MIPRYGRGLRVVRLVLLLLKLEAWIVRWVTLSPVHHDVAGCPKRRESGILSCFSQLKSLHLQCFIQKTRLTRSRLSQNVKAAMTRRSWNSDHLGGMVPFVRLFC